MATDPQPSLDELQIVDPQDYADNGYPHAAWARLRRECPVYRYDRGDDCTPFWAITKHADIVRVSRRPQENLNGPRLAVFPEGSPPEEPIARHLLNMDPPDHAGYRKLTSQHFTPRAIRRLAPEIERITRERLDEVAGAGEIEIDFVERVSAPIPLAVLADLLGVPRSDWKLMFRWTNEIIGSSDPEYQVEGGDAQATADQARRSLFQYFADMAQERRRQPREDIVSLLANASVEGAPIPPFELLSYYFLLVVAGNETTRNAMSGGLLAFMQNPEQLALLREDPARVDTAVEEIVRWTTPVIQFCRTATVDFELRGRTIRAGDSMCLFYPSANRDEEVFDDPFAFRIDRKPNPHLAFGIGEHFCLGANLARLELRALFRALAERLVDLEQAGPAERLRSSFLGGVKHLPVRMQLAAA
ncbi:MAG: cytochrome P450 [Myxococcota bacterium]